MANGSKKGSAQSITLGYRSFACLVGLFAGVATLLNVLLSGGSPSLSETDNVILRVCLLVAMAVLFGFYYLVADRISTRYGQIVMLALSLMGFCSWVLLALLPESNLYVHGVFTLITACGLASLLELWFLILCTAGIGSETQSFIATAFAASLILCLGGSFLGNQLVQMVVTAVLWLVSAVLNIMVARTISENGSVGNSIVAKESDSRSKIKRESVIMLVVIYVQFGYIVGQLQASSSHVVPWVITAGLLMSVIMAVDGLEGKPRISEASIYPITIPLTVMAFTCAYAFGMRVHIIMLSVLAVVITVYLATGWVALIRHVVYSRLSPVRALSKARFGEFIGVACGFVVGYAAESAAATNLTWGIQVTIVVAIAYAFVASFFHKERFPDTTISSDGTEKMAATQEKGLWKRRCNAVSERYGLSERQREVLVLIGQGRNAEYVANSLVISVSTVQTHIRNIYQKLGVHSRQELLDLIENTKLYGED